MTCYLWKLGPKYVNKLSAGPDWRLAPDQRPAQLSCGKGGGRRGLHCERKLEGRFVPPALAGAIHLWAALSPSSSCLYLYLYSKHRCHSNNALHAIVLYGIHAVSLEMTTRVRRPFLVWIFWTLLKNYGTLRPFTNFSLVSIQILWSESTYRNVEDQFHTESDF